MYDAPVAEVKLKNSAYKVSIFYLGNGRYELLRNRMGTSTGTDHSYADTLWGAKWKARRILKKTESLRKKRVYE